MNKEAYQAIIKALDNRLQVCSENFDKIQETVDIEQLSLIEAKRLRSVAISELDVMTQIAMVDLYHVIGMGNLTVTQSAEFLRKMKQYLQYRPLLKLFSSHLLSIEELPQITHNIKFQLTALGGVWLSSGEDQEAVLDKSSLADFIARSADQIKAAPLRFELQGRQLKIHQDQLENFCKYGQLIGCSNTVILETLMKKIADQKDFCGVQWGQIDEDGYVHGEVIAPRVYDKMQGFLTIVKQSEQ